ncbi:HK97-gp10 family putative phage morphogenesis protein [Pseudomonas graminis]|uniref:Phage protein, HK97 gp10 family n=1 Tax=Pseudomonas graminis TaxID=158627 RepID=A0A1I0J055_9PSED|nr:HK97-gp10 family putative phage morphogenesis protein [Pseudomonas graminis]SEU03090.1 phage protein, HK97 gp10 family [Pseudomonas graminis]
MGDWVEYKLKGTEELSAKFRGLTEEMRRKVVTPAAKDAMEIVLADAKDRAARIDDPETSNFIPKNLALVERKAIGIEVGAVVMSVGVRKRKKGQGGGNTFYWWWVELGTEKNRARPFLRPALANNREALFKEFLSSAKYQLLKLGVN